MRGTGQAMAAKESMGSMKIRRLQEGLCQCGWDRFFYLEKNGFYDKDHITPRPDEKKMKEIEDGCVQQSLFD